MVKRCFFVFGKHPVDRRSGFLRYSNEQVAAAAAPLRGRRRRLGFSAIVFPSNPTRKKEDNDRPTPNSAISAAGTVNFFHLQVSKLMGESRREMNGFASRRRLVAGVSKFGEFGCFWWWNGTVTPTSQTANLLFPNVASGRGLSFCSQCPFRGFFLSNFRGGGRIAIGGGGVGSGVEQ